MASRRSRPWVLTPLLWLAIPRGIPAQELEPLKVDVQAGRVTFGAKAVKTDVYPQLKGAVEYLITLPRGKSYESCFESTAMDATKLYQAIQQIGVKPGKPASEEKPAEGGLLKMSVEWKEEEKIRSEPIESFIIDEETKKPMEHVQWVFFGSKQGYVPEIDAMGLMVLSTRNLVGLYQGDPTPLIVNPIPLMTGHRYKINKRLLPKEGTPVKIILEAAK
jgi:hypothetical protein